MTSVIIILNELKAVTEFQVQRFVLRVTNKTEFYIQELTKINAADILKQRQD